jgi:arsenite methyltransferase
MLQFDAEASRRVEATYTTPDVVEQRQAVLGALGLGPGERVIDIGTGPGLLAAEIAAAVGPDGLVCGIDIGDSMLALARARTTRPNSAPMEFRQAGADRLPYAQASFDVAVATQVLEYVKDVPGALAEITRVLRPGAGCWCWTPTGTPSSGTPATRSAWPGCWPPGSSTWSDSFFSLNRYLFRATKAA